MALVDLGGGSGGGGGSYTIPPWEWWHDDLIDISALTDVGSGDAGGTAFTSTSYSATTKVLTGVIGNGGDCCWELAQIADAEDFVYAVWLGMGGGSATSVAQNVIYGLAFAKRSGGSFSLALDQYYSAAARDPSNSTSFVGRASSASGWNAAPFTVGGTNMAMESQKVMVLQRVDDDLTGYMWQPGGVLKQLFTVAAYNGVGRLLIGAQNQGTDSTNSIHVLAARTTGLSIANNQLIVAS